MARLGHTDMDRYHSLRRRPRHIGVEKRLGQLKHYAVVLWLALGAIVAIFLTDYASVLHQARYAFPLLPLAMLLPGALIAALDDSTSRSAATVWVTYYIALALLWPVRTNYGWLQMAQLVEKGAVFYRLNPNELPQAIPVLRDDATYIVTSKADTVRAHTDIPIVTRLAPPVAVKSMRAFTGPLKLYTTKAAENRSRCRTIHPRQGVKPLHPGLVQQIHRERRAPRTRRGHCAGHYR